MHSNRYFIDRRVGFTCIRDRTKIEDMESSCLEYDDESIVKLWEGKLIDSHNCPICGRSCSKTWNIPYEIESEAEKLCNELNKLKENQP